MAKREEFIDLARSQVGVKEEGGSNRVIYSEYFDTTAWQWLNGKKNGIASWCSIWICWLFCQLIGPERALKFLGCPKPSDNCAASCSYLWKYLTALGWKVNTSEGEPGDIIFLNTKKAKCGHIGMIEAVEGGKYKTIEGNKSDKVARGSYTTSSASIYGICRPKWSEIEEAPKPEPTPEPAPAPTPEPSGVNYKVKVNSYLRVRKGPGTDFPEVGRLYNGDIVTVYETSGSWGRIGADRWASLSYMTKVTAGERYKVKTNSGSGLRLRSGPGTNYLMLTLIPNGTTLTVTKISNGWAFTSYGSYSGWCSANYLVKA